MLKTEEYLVETTGQCIRLARECARLGTRLEAISNEPSGKNQKTPASSGKRPRPSRHASLAWIKKPGGFLLFLGGCKRPRQRP